MMTVKDDEELLPVGIDDEDALMFTLTTTFEWQSTSLYLSITLYVCECLSTLQ